MTLCKNECLNLKKMNQKRVMTRRVSARSGRGSPRGDGWSEDGDMPHHDPLSYLPGTHFCDEPYLSLYFKLFGLMNRMLFEEVIINGSIGTIIQALQTPDALR